jgi:heme/copper-type cytochrome/quinol oxidase subunit 1
MRNVDYAQQKPQSQNFSQPPPGQPQYGYYLPQRVRLENFGIIFVLIGTILIGVGVIMFGLAPGDIYVSVGTSSGNVFHPDIRINSILVGAILCGVGTMISGFGTALITKAHFEQREYIRK